MSGKLTPKQAIFIAEYLLDGNATRAALAAGFAKASAAVTGARMLRNAKVAAAIASRMEKVEITSEWILAELKKLAGYDPGKLYDDNGDRIPVCKLDDQTRAAVASVEDEVVESLGEADKHGSKKRIVTRKQKLKMADKVRPLELLGRYRKLFTDRIEHDGRVTLEQMICGEGTEND